MTQAENIAIAWLQTTMMSNSAYPYYAPYFEQLLTDGWTEPMLLKLRPYTFEVYEAAKTIAPCTIAEFLSKGKEALSASE